MANQDSPFGLRAIGKIGQNRDNQGLAEFSIAASATAKFSLLTRIQVNQRLRTIC